MGREINVIDKILIVLSFWEGDREKLGKQARLLADLEPEHSSLADVLIVSRFDTTHDPKVVEYLSRKFNIHLHTSQRRGTGWPCGCNALWFGSLEWCYHMMTSKKVPYYKALLNMEADCIPTRRDWLVTVREQWKEVNQKHPVYMAGDIINMGGKEHINANAVISTRPAFFKWLSLVAGTREKPAGWDWYLSHDFRRWGWAKLPCIRSCWNTPTFTEPDWEREQRGGTALFHGVKDDSLVDLSRKKLL